MDTGQATSTTALVFGIAPGYCSNAVTRRRSTIDHVRVACDSLVALGNATRDGTVLFAKNSDRPASECQPLMQAPRQVHASGSRLRCTYIEIPQVTETARLIGSQPFWCWGFEHGLNEHGVAIGNHTVFTKDPLEGKGLIGMDLVRLGLERGRSAQQAAEVMTALIETHGQGGSGYGDKDWPYHNSFLIADRTTAFVLETSDRRWVARRVADVGSVSNHLTIGADWDAISNGAIEHAVANGWWSTEADGRFDFAAAYRDTSMAPDVISSGRHLRTCTLLESAKGGVSVDSLRSTLRDHYGAALPPRDVAPDDARYFSVCMHADPVGTTTASVIAQLPPDAREAPVYWASLGSPCVSAFIPLYIGATVPSALGRGGLEPSDDSPWWQFKMLLTAVARDWPRHAPRVRAELDSFEADLAARLRHTDVARQSVDHQTAFMSATLGDLLERVHALRTDIEKQ